jgi:hypothetical protein
MPYTTAGRNLMLDALKGTNPTTPITHAGLFQADAGKAVTATASTDTFNATAHGYANGDLVVLSGLTGGTGLVAGDAYFVIGQTANTFQLAKIVGGAAVDFTSDITGGTSTRLVELTGGSPAYARKAIAFAAASGGVIDDTTNGAIFDIPASAVVNYAGFYSALTAGTLLGIRSVTPETFAGQGTYTLTDAKLDLNL